VVILRRLAFVQFPLSILFIKYYSHLGRLYHVDGTATYTGVGEQKNSLGTLCLISGIAFAWTFLQKRQDDVKGGVKGNFIDYLLIGMLAWLLYMSNSQTSLSCLLVATSLFFMSRTTVIAQKPSRIIVVLICGVLLLAALEATLNVKELVFSLLGRNSTLTDRTDIWEVVLGLEVSPLVGSGFTTFWTGDRMELIWRMLRVKIVQAHSGYIEQYLNLGFIGVAFIGAIMLSGLLKIRKHLDVDPPAAMLRLCFIVTAVLYNYTEAAFYGINNMWLLLLLGTMDMSDQRDAKRTASQQKVPLHPFQSPFQPRTSWTNGLQQRFARLTD
jgi:O-antigen ligase